MTLPLAPAAGLFPHPGQGQACHHEGARGAGRAPVAAVQGLRRAEGEVDGARHVPRAG